MKKFLAFIMSVVLIFSLCACGSSSQANSNNTTNTASEVKATVRTNEGATEHLTSKELCDLSAANNISFEKKYWCAKVTVTGTLKKIDGAITINGTSYDWALYVEGGSCDWFIGKTRYNESNITEDFIATLSIGDTIEISGEIVGASFGEVDISNGPISVKKK